MAARVIVDAGFLVALLSRRDRHHSWAATQAVQTPPPWVTCEAAVSEAFHLLGGRGRPALSALLRRGAVATAFDFTVEFERVLSLMDKYAGVPMSLADGCLLRMTETSADPLLITTDDDFRVYRRHGRQVVPCALPLRPSRSTP